MSRSSLYVLLLLVLIALFVNVNVRADEGDDGSAANSGGVGGGAGGGEGASGEEDAEEVVESEEVVRALVPSPDVSTTVHFPDFADRKFVQGETVTALIGLSNSGDKTYNVSYVGAALHSPFDYSYYIQNFTVKVVSGELKPNSELTIEYKFKPDLNLEPLEFHLSGFVLYNNTDSEPFKSAFYNGTISLVERPSDVDARTLFTYVLLVSAVGLIAYIFVNVNSKGKKGSRESGTRSAASAQDWEANVYTPSTKAKAFGAKKPTAAKPKKS